MTSTNLVNAEALRSYVERFELLQSNIAQVKEDQKAMLAEAKAKGFQPNAMKEIVRLRAMKPVDLMEAEALMETYRHAMGMSADLPLFRHLDLMAVDITKRDEVIEAMKKLVPANGSLVVETADGKPVRLTRDKDGNVSVTEVSKIPAPLGESPAAPAPARQSKEPLPDCGEGGAEELGRAAYVGNVAIIKNPFPFGDARRARWDKGWRDASGSDGMGPGK
jgi:uncharacterized protein (UPF0335 family)